VTTRRGAIPGKEVRFSDADPLRILGTVDNDGFFPYVTKGDIDEGSHHSFWD